MKNEEIKKVYSKYAKKYNEIVLREKKYTAHKKMGLWVVNEIKRKNAKILDLGCGTGLSSLEFFKKGYEVIGIDIAPGMIEEAKNLPFKKLIFQDLEEPFPVKNEQCDAVVLIGVMEFIKNPLKLFKEINRILKKRAIFSLTVPKKLPKSSKLEIKNYYKNEIEPYFKKAGFEIIGCREFFGCKKRGEIIRYIGYMLRKI